MTKTDVRTAKTQAKIEAAIMTLCRANVDFDQLTAPKLAAAAGISRQTFYRHYMTPKQVITDLIQRHLGEFLRSFRLQDLTARSMTTQLLAAWQGRPAVFQLVEWSNTRKEFMQYLSAFNQRIAQNNQVHLLNAEAICNVYAATIYMFLREYVLKRTWTLTQATELLLHLTNNMDEIF